MFPFKRKKNEQPQQQVTPKWMMFLVVGFVAYALVTGDKKTFVEPTQPVNTDSEKPTVEKAQDHPAAEDKLFNIDVLADKFLPEVTINLSVQDTKDGEGEPAVCGQTVTVGYSSTTEDKKEIEKDQKITFRIGSGKAMPALEKGVLGMRRNGKRTITAPGKMAYGIEQYARPDVPAKANIIFEAEMLDTTPPLPDSSAFRVIGDALDDSSEVYLCNSQAKLNVVIWDVAGKKLYDSKENGGEPVSFTIGESEVFIGLEQGAMQMSAGMRRNLIVPPSLQKTLNGTPSKIDFHLPKNQTVLVDIEAIP